MPPLLFARGKVKGNEQMQIDFKALEQALSPIEEIGQGELTFDAGSTTITLRVLLPSEEVEAQKYAATALNESDEGEHSAVDYLDRLRVGILSHAVVAVGDNDFRGLQYVETGEKLDNGTAIKVPKHKAMRQLIGRWSRAALTAVFARFNELVNRTEAEAEKLIEYEPSNIPAEIDRLNKRIEELKSEMERADAVEKTKFSDKVKALAESDAARQAPQPVRRQQPTPEEQPPDPQVLNPRYQPEPPPPAAPAPRRAGPIIPEQAPPPVERPAHPQGQRPAHHQPPAPSLPDSSFVNADDEDGMSAALDAEHRRIAEMRRRAAMGERQVDEGSALQTVHPQIPRRRPPHLDAAEADEDVGFTSAAAQQARHLGHLDGKEVFAMPAQDLEVPAPKAGSPRPVVNPTPNAGGSVNPRFKPRNQP